jgi:hypothetical protein
MVCFPMRLRRQKDRKLGEDREWGQRQKTIGRI